MAASERQIDVLGQQVGAVYAQALYAAAEEQGQVQAIVQQVHSLVDDVLDSDADFERLLASEMVAIREKLQILDRVLGGQASTLLMNFLKVLAENERLGFLRPISRELHEIHNEKCGRVRVEVTTAVPLPGDLSARLHDRIRSMLGCEPELVARTDPDVIGGVLLRVGDTVYDGSVVTQLERMRVRFHDRSIEEIEAHRETFQLEERPS